MIHPIPSSPFNSKGVTQCSCENIIIYYLLLFIIKIVHKVRKKLDTAIQ